MKRRTFLKLGTGTVVSSALAACGGGNGPVGHGPDPAPQFKSVVGWNQVSTAI